MGFWKRQVGRNKKNVAGFLIGISHSKKNNKSTLK